MIRVENLTRRFGGILAVDNITYHVGRGQICGFLGPNGAGKTTTLRILAGYLPATSGRARVAGFDVHKQSLDVRRRIGYLPENAPLYAEMRVQEYLKYRAAIKGVPRGKTASRLEEVLEKVGILDHRRRIIGQLSKGYRQRVGLADALIHDPPVLLLDEPTSGLDPNQVREMRGTLKTLGEEKTLFLSSHILPEIEAVCDRVVVIHRGQIVREGPIAELKGSAAGQGSLLVEGLGAEAGVINEGLQKLGGVKKVKIVGRGEVTSFELEADPGRTVPESVFRLFADSGWTLVGMHRQVPSLEDIFWRATTGSIRDQGGQP